MKKKRKNCYQIWIRFLILLIVNVLLKTAKEHYIYSNCVCPDGKKIVNFETYTQQVFDNEAILLSEEEKTKYELIWSAIRLSGKCTLYNMGPLRYYIIVCSSM